MGKATARRTNASVERASKRSPFLCHRVPIFMHPERRAVTNRSIDSVTSRSLLEQAIQLSGSLKASILSSKQSENPEAIETEVEVLSVKVVQPSQRQSLTTATKRASHAATKKPKTLKKLEQENLAENPFELKFAEAKATI